MGSKLGCYFKKKSRLVRCINTGVWKERLEFCLGTYNPCGYVLTRIFCNGYMAFTPWTAAKSPPWVSSRVSGLAAQLFLNLTLVTFYLNRFHNQ